MSELTDDQLDGLFRKSAEEFDPPFDPAAWQDMKTRLDTNDRSPAGGLLIWKNLLRWGLPIVLLLLLSVGGWYAYRRAHPVAGDTRSQSVPTAGAPLNQTREQSQADVTAPTPDHKPERTTPVDPEEFDDHAAKQPTDPVALVAEPARSDKRLEKSVIHSENNGTPDPEATTKRSTPAYRPKTERNRLSRLPAEATASVGKNSSGLMGYGLKNTRLRRGERTRNGRNLPDGQYRVAHENVSQILERASVRKRRGASNLPSIVNRTADRTGSVTPLITNETGPVVLPALADLTARPGTWPRLSPLLNRPVTVHPDTTASRVVSPQVLQRGLSIRVAIAPDVSTVGLKNFSRPGTNIGLLLEYRLASRWSVQAGVIQSTKLYRALPDDYIAPAGAWGGPIKPLSVDGRCNMLDIPINLRYDVLLRPQADGRLSSRWFVSGGVTSYIMEQEDYNYDYPYVPHNYQPTSKGVSTGGYGLSNLNLSVGYERALSRRLAWQVEPFVKMPLRGVGYFKTDLFSTGVFLSIRYKL